MKKALRIMSVVLAGIMLFSVCFTVYAASTTDTVKNVIFMIGDGMGENHLMMAKQELEIELYMDTFPIKGQSMTRSFSSSVTDSAAGGTALACGTRTTNSCVGVFPLDPFGAFTVPTSLTEAAMDNGMRTGVVTTDGTTGATPASFSAHTASRANAQIIADQQMTSGIDIIWGHAEDYVNNTTASVNGYTYVSTISEMQALANGSKSFGQFGGDAWSTTPELETTPTLAEMTTSAIDILDNENGFFLMVEGAHIDKHSHGQNVDDMVDALEGFDDAVKVALDFAQADGDTVVLVTADHETGGITLIDGQYQYTQGSHSGVNVPLLIYGSESVISNGDVIKNKEVPLRVAQVMGIEEDFVINGLGFIPQAFLKIFSFLGL